MSPCIIFLPLAGEGGTIAQMQGITGGELNSLAEMRARFGSGGHYLFGEWSVPDAFFTPVATRFRHYQIDLGAHGDDGTAAAYRDALLAQPDFLEWSTDALSGR